MAGSLAATGVLVPLAVSGVPASATSVSGLQAEAHQLALQIDLAQTKLGILSEEYDQASAHEAMLQTQISSDSKAFAVAQLHVSHDQTALQSQAVAAYVAAGSTSGISPVFSSSDASALPLQQTYLQAAAGNIDVAISSLQNSEIALNARRVALSQAETAAVATARTLSDARSNEIGLESSLHNTLSGVQGNLAIAVRAQELAAQAEAARQAAAEAAAARAAAQPAQVTTAPTIDVAGSGSGAGAVRAAQGQIGVPYVWAGATPGGGFDCSGLTMWAWGQAGVSLPHSAAAQYESIEHIPFSDLQPGDLIFYASYGYIYHVVMYVGGGDVIQAEETGTNVMITALPGGAYAAGRP